MNLIKNITLLIAGLFVLVSCNHNFDHIPLHESPRAEYSPNMYVSEAYEPMTVVVDSFAYPEAYNLMPNNNGSNLREPVKNTIKRGFTPYNMPKDSLNYAALVVKSPLTVNDQVIADGEALYKRFCSHCHGDAGDGKGPVAEKFMGVASLMSDRLKGVSEGHIFHVISKGKGLMSSHASQILPEERWKIAHFVKEKLQKAQ